MSKKNKERQNLINALGMHITFADEKIPFEDLEFLLMSINTVYGPRAIVKVLYDNIRAESEGQPRGGMELDVKKHTLARDVLKKTLETLPKGKLRDIRKEYTLKNKRGAKHA